MNQPQLLLKGKACTDYTKMKAITAATTEEKCWTTPGLLQRFIYGSFKKKNVDRLQERLE